MKATLQSPPNATPRADPQGKDEATVTKTTGKEVVMTIDDGPVLAVSLASGRFAAKMLLSVGVFVAVLSWVALHGMTIGKHIPTAEVENYGSLLAWPKRQGSSVSTYKFNHEQKLVDRADENVGYFQAANAAVTTAIDIVFQGYLGVFLAVATIFLRNVRWYPGDDPERSYSRIKRLVLWALCPVVTYNIRVAITAMFVSHTVDRAFVGADLIVGEGVGGNITLNATTAISYLSTTGSKVSVLDTILRGAVVQNEPFRIKANTSCSAGSGATDDPFFELPAVKDVRSTAVVYGFPRRYWNLEAMPFGLIPSHIFSVQLQNSSISDEDKVRFEAFREQSNVSWVTLYESFLQGKLLFERSLSDAGDLSVYPCVWADGKHELDLHENDTTIVPNDPRNIFLEGQHKGKRRCFGAVSSLGALGNITDPAKHNVDSFLSSVVGAFLKTTTQLDSQTLSLTIEVYDINAQLKFTSMTMDMAYHEGRRYRDTTLYCNGSSLLPDLRDKLIQANRSTPDEIDIIESILCDQEFYPYFVPGATCSQTSCIFLDQSGTISFKKQLQLMPYLTNCSTSNLNYNADLRNFFPSECQNVDDTAFLYGLGTYLSGEAFHRSIESKIPFIRNPRRHVVLTFGKLEWFFHNIHANFGAKCGTSSATSPAQCSGLLYELESVTTKSTTDIESPVLLLSKSKLPAALWEASYAAPVQLVTLHSRPLFYPKSKKFYEWEYLDLKHFQSTDLTPSIAADCSPLVESYISTVETNKYYIDDPRQPLYTSALFYLFQDAVVKTVERNKSSCFWKPRRCETFDAAFVIGTTPLKNDIAQHRISFKIPTLSLAFTIVGLLLLRLLAVAATVTPVQRMRMSDAIDENAVHQYARLRQEDEYPRQVFVRKLKLQNGKRLPLDNYVVDNLTLHRKANVSKKTQL